MASKRRTPAKPPVLKPPASKYKSVIEGEVTVDETDGVVVWDYIPEVQSNIPSHGYAAGGIVEAHLAGRRVRITIEEL